MSLAEIDYFFIFIEFHLCLKVLNIHQWNKKTCPTIYHVLFFSHLSWIHQMIRLEGTVFNSLVVKYYCLVLFPQYWSILGWHLEKIEEKKIWKMDNDKSIEEYWEWYIFLREKFHIWKMSFKMTTSNLERNCIF